MAIFSLSSASAGADAAGAPGIPNTWAPAFKQAVGTAYEARGAQSPVWVTLSQGILTEIFYPTVDRAQMRDFQFLVTRKNQLFSEQKVDTVAHASYSGDGMVILVSGRQRDNAYSYEQEIITDPHSPVVRIHTRFRWNQPDLRLFVLMKPAINNTGAQNLVRTSEEGLFATGLKSSQKDHGSVGLAVVSSAPWATTSAGYVGYSDGWQDISRHFAITESSHEAGPGNVAATGEVKLDGKPELTLDLAIGFSDNTDAAATLAHASLSIPFEKVRAQYEAGWNSYLEGIAKNNPSGRFIAESPFARHSVEIIKMHEDKQHRGAIVASLSNPGIPESDSAADMSGGYHLVWPRDLYHAAMGLLAAGDVRTPVSILKYYGNTQKSDGSWAQNFFVDGTPHWTGLQMDEVSFPILLAAALKKHGAYPLSHTDLAMVRKASSFLIAHGPQTDQDRWEEIGGYVPSTLAAEIAALRKASDLIGDPLPRSVAQDWQSKLETWTWVQNGSLGKHYYLRTSPGGNPNTEEQIQLANGAGPALASDILDGGFLELVRLGVRSSDDPRIISTLGVYDSPGTGISRAARDGSAGMIYRRYNRDEYGPNHQGGFWPLLAGERGHYAVAAQDLDTASAELSLMEKSAGESSLIPEQVETSPDGSMKTGMGVASPLVWAHAEDILLHRSIEERKIFDAP